MSETARALAIFIDFENLALGFQGRRDRFDMARVLERLVEKGKIVCKKAYADWSRFSGYTYMLHNSAIELIEIPRRAQSGKNSADIRLCVDAMDLAYSKEHIDTFVVVSGDSDFSPLVSKLKELGKHVIGLGMTESTSDLLRDNCDEFIYYEDLGRTEEIGTQLDESVPESKRKAFGLLIDALVALRRDFQGGIGSSMIKDTIKRKKPSFNESYHGYRSFSELLLDAQKEGLVELAVDKKSRTYVVARFGSEMNAPQPAIEGEGGELLVAGSGEELPLLGRRKPRRRRRGRNGNGPAQGEEREIRPAGNEGGRIRMSVPLPSGGRTAGQNAPSSQSPHEEEEDDLDVFEDSDPRLGRIDELDSEDDADFEEEPAPPPQQKSQPVKQPPQGQRPQLPPRPVEGQRPPLPQRQPQRPPQPHPARPALPQPQPRPQPQPQNRPAPQPQPQSRPVPQPQPRPVVTPRVFVPGELPPPSDDEISFSEEAEPVRKPASAPAPRPQPQSRPQVQPAPQPQRPRSQPVPVERKPAVEEVVPAVREKDKVGAEKPGKEPVEVAEAAEATEKEKAPKKAATTKKPARQTTRTAGKAPATKPAGKSASGTTRGRKKPAEPAPE